MVDLSYLLSRSANEVTAPKILPPGQYLFRVMDKDESKQSQAGNPQIMFSVQAEAPVDVDSETLEGINFPYKMMHFFTLSEASLFYLKSFFVHLGFDDDGTSLRQMLDQSVGRAFRGTVIHRPDRRDTSKMQANLVETFQI